MTDTYLFDLDGTLVDTAPDLHNALNSVLAKIKVDPVDIALTRHWVGHGARKMISSALEQHNQGSPEENFIEELYSEFVACYRRNIATHSKPYCGVRLTLQHLAHKGYKLGVVTNKRYDLSELLLAEINLLQYFQVLVGGDTASVPKPDPDPLLYACKALNTTPENALYVGDSKTDVLCARAAACPIVLVPYGYNQGVEVCSLGADHTVQSLVELI